ALRQFAAQHLSQGAQGLSLGVAAPLDVLPVPFVTHEVMEAARATGVFQETEIQRDSLQHPVVVTMAPQAGTEPQGAGVIVSRVTALAPGDTVDGMLDQ